MVVIQPGKPLVGAIGIFTLSPIRIFWISDRDLQIGSKSRNQSRTDVGGTLPEDREPSLQGNQGQQEPPHELKKHTGASNLQTNGVPQGYVRIPQ